MAALDHLAPTATSTPDDITGVLIQAVRVGGTDDGITDRPRMLVVSYGPTRPMAQALASQVRSAMDDLGGSMVGDVLVDRVSTDTAPIGSPYRNPDVRAVPAYYRLEWRRSS